MQFALERVSKALNINHEDSLLLTCGKLIFLSLSLSFVSSLRSIYHLLIFIKTLI